MKSSLFSVMNNNPNRSNQVLTAQNARLDIMGELEAIILYQNHYDATDDPNAKRTILDIMNEEKVHVGQLFGLLFKVDPDSKTLFEKGYSEFMEQS